MTSITKNVSLAPLTTIDLGGAARYFSSCQSIEELRKALRFAQDERLPVHILGGGSNTVFADGGFDGLVLHVALRGVRFDEAGGAVLVRVGAGEEWDELVATCVERNLAGLECLSGIPGFVGATPMQNVGAYGQQVSDVIDSVAALDRKTGKLVSFDADACSFSYRTSRFKGVDRERYIVTEVIFRLVPGGTPAVRYSELAAAAGSTPTLRQVRETVLALRRQKSMVVDATDPHSRSCGSFFLNVIVSGEAFRQLQERYRELGGSGDIPSFPAGDTIKVPAGWLVEQAGFSRGTRRGGVGISPNHALALVNYGGTSKELLALAAEIQAAVTERFGIELVPEPVVVK